MTDAAAVARPSSPYYSEPSHLLVGDLDVAYRRAGSGEPVLFLHGAGSTRMWLPFYERLSQSVDLIAPEHPGFGDTAFPDWLDGFDDLVLHYRDFLELLSLERVHLVGLLAGRLDRLGAGDLLPRAAEEPDADHAGRAPPAGGAEAESLRDAARGDPGAALRGRLAEVRRLPAEPELARRHRPRVRRARDVLEADVDAELRPEVRAAAPARPGADAGDRRRGRPDRAERARRPLRRAPAERPPRADPGYGPRR